MRSVEKSAKTYDDAVELALAELGATPDMVKIVSLEEASRGFLGFGSRDAKVLVTLLDTPTSLAGDFLEKVFDKMGLSAKAEITLKNDEMFINVTGSGLGILIGRRGETLDALQYLVSLVVNRDFEKYIRVTLDTENYRAKREETLTNLANKLASRVLRYRHSLTLEPMNPYERRIIHAALQHKEFITTSSTGDEPMRRVVISYNDRGRRRRSGD